MSAKGYLIVPAHAYPSKICMFLINLLVPNLDHIKWQMSFASVSFLITFETLGLGSKKH